MKDTPSIVNTPGLDGLIIIGYDLKTKTFVDAKSSDSGLKDSAMINDIVSKNVDRLFSIDIFPVEFEGHLLSVVHIPPSVNKPHVIRNYQTFHDDGRLKKEEQHRIFVRRGTSTREASRSEIDNMYFDNRNIVPEYKLDVYYNPIDTGFDITGSIVTAYLDLTFENIGRRPLAIIEIKFDLLDRVTLHEEDKIKFQSGRGFLTNPIIIHPDEIIYRAVRFYTDGGTQTKYINATIETLRSKTVITNWKVRSTHNDNVPGELFVSFDGI